MGILRVVPLLLVLLGCATRPGWAQTASPTDERYTPADALPQGREVSAYIIGASTCVHSNRPDVLEALRHALPMLARNAAASRRAFSATGVAVEWGVEAGLGYLTKLGPLDQVVAGRNWVNDAVVATIWQVPDAPPETPQVILVERTVRPGADRIEVSAPRILGRVIGPDAILAWVARGAPIESAPSP
jgi:hypothetical protein